QKPTDLAVKHADELRAARYLKMQQLLRGQAERVLLVHRRDVIEPVEIRDRLQIGLVLDQLLGAARQKPDMRIDSLDDFAVEFEHEAQHAVRRRMLRAEVDREIALVVGHRAIPWPSRRRAAARSPRPPTARGNRSYGIPARAAPCRRPRA